MEGLHKKTVYLETLENLFQELIQARSMSSGGRKLILLGVLYDVHRVHQFFLQIENNLSESIDIHNILKYDADVDYNQWAVKLDIKFDVKAFYMPDEEENDADADSVKKTLWHVFDTFSRDELIDISCDRTSNVQHLLEILTNDVSIDNFVLLLNESIVALRESLLHIHTCISRHRITNEDGIQLYKHELEYFIQTHENEVMEEFESWKDQFDDNEELVMRNINGKYCTEMLAFFMSEFLKSRIATQVETDKSGFESEMAKLHFVNVPADIDTLLYYSALRELFEYKNDIVVPHPGRIGKFFFKHRKEVDAKQRVALFKFIKMIELIEEEKKPKPEKTSTITEKPQTEEFNGEKSVFYQIVQHEEPQKLVIRLHQLIDGRKGADVGCVLLKCVQDGYLTRKPKQKEFKSEFTLIGGWKAIHNYMDDNSEKALDRANKIVIF